MTLRTLFAAAATALALALPAHAVEVGEDGLHKPAWLVETFRDMRDDLEDAQAQGKRLLLMFEQRGCIYCTRMHENVYPDPEITRMLSEEFMVVQVNLFGNIEMTDFDGTVLQERDMARRWGVVFTPTLIFAPEVIPETGTLAQSASMIMPGAFERGTTRLMLQWVLERGYEGEEHFQHYVARMLQAQRQ
ncbi:MAG: thioredoxin family protein [Roseinatronobacter sp.]